MTPLPITEAMPVSYDRHKHRRRSIRLKGYDYSSPGAYFVTICTRDQEPLLREVVDGLMRPSALGRIADEAWRWLAERYPYVRLDAHVVMPNHLHGVFWIVDDDSCRGSSRTAPTYPIKRKALGRLVGAFKTVSTKEVNQLRGTPGVPLWQRNYYEHIVRSERAPRAIRQYTADNPVRWHLDRYNPLATGRDPQAEALRDLLQDDRWTNMRLAAPSAADA